MEYLPCLKLKESPPRVRGIPGFPENAAYLRRITPACAGNTEELLVGVIGIKNHPRVCGEYPATVRARSSKIESPPRVRGIQTVTIVNYLQGRITPACAGNTTLNPADKKLMWNHPRVCGEYVADKIDYGILTESPPRVRGIP